MILNIGRKDYEITAYDQFRDNGACVQLLSQSKESGSWGHRPNPVLSKRAVKEISEFKRVEIPNGYGDRVSTFTLDIKEGDK